MSEFLRLDFVRDEMKVDLAAGDIVTGFTGDDSTIETDTLKMWNSAGSQDNRRHIKSFAPRKNEGVQPVGDDVVVNVSYTRSDTTCHAGMCNHWQSSDVKTWKPNYAELLKMQNEFDKKESEMITGKEMKIVEAVNYCKAMIEVNDGELAIGYTPSGDLTSHCTYGHEYYDDICTIAEFNQCIEEMATNSWVNGGHWDYLQYKKDCELNDIDTSNKRLQKEDEKPVYTKAMQDAGEMPSVGMVCDIQYKSGNLFKGFTISYMSEFGFVTKNPVSGVESFCGNVDIVHFLAPRTPEEIEAEELEVAKKEQREIVAVVLSCEHNKKFNDHEPTVPSDFLDEAGSLQDLGLLDKIILPLKG